MSDTILKLVTNIVIAAAILLVGIWLAKQLKEWAGKLMERHGLDIMLASFIKYHSHYYIGFCRHRRTGETRDTDNLNHRSHGCCRTGSRPGPAGFPVKFCFRRDDHRLETFQGR